jgi:hypothetical protein
MLLGILLFASCGNEGRTTGENKTGTDKKVLQQADGTISLKVDKADCYSDMDSPSSNTAEWNVVVSKSGRFNVWLSSATKDTTNLQYQNSVRLSILDNRLETRPACDKIIKNSSDVSYPYYRADSFMGSLYIQDTGLYTIQLISDRIVRPPTEVSSTPADQTRLMSVMFVPLKK